MVLEATHRNIEKAAEEILNGNIVAFPTETVYGLGANAYNPLAVSKIFEVKNRPSFNPLIVHIDSREKLSDICFINDERIFSIIEKYWPGPLTLILPKKDTIPDIVTAGNSTVAVRIPNHPVALELIKIAGIPIAAPSANAFGFLSPTNAKHVEKQLGEKIDIILDGGESLIGIESTIIEFEEKKIKILRPGGLTTEEIESILGDVEIDKSIVINPKSPGQLFHHYAPSKKIVMLTNKVLSELHGLKVGAMLLNENKFDFPFTVVKYLSKSGDLREAAANLFKYLHEFESEDIDIIAAEHIEKKGLGIAIMDRLSKAVNRYIES